MDPKVTIAISTSIVSIIVAGISAIISYINGKKVIQANTELEILKFNIEKKRNLQQILDESLRSQYKALGDQIKQIQSFKDTLILLENSSTDSFDSETALESIEHSRKNLLNCFQNDIEYLDENSYKASHNAKNDAVVIESKLTDLLKNREYVNLSDKEKKAIRLYRKRLTEYQNIIRDNRLKILEGIL